MNLMLDKGEGSGKTGETESLLKKFQFDPEEFLIRRKFMKFADEDAEILKSLLPLVEKNADGLADEFYGSIGQHPQLMMIIERSNTSMDQLKRIQRKYLLSLFSGVYDANYVESRLRIGVAHYRIGLGPMWYLGSYSVYMDLLAKLVDHSMPFRRRARRKAHRAVSKILALDSQLAIDAYMMCVRTTVRDTVGAFEASVLQQVSLATQQAAAVSQTRSALADIERIAQQNLDLAHNWTDRSGDSLKAAETGQQVVKKTVTAISSVEEKMRDMTARITRLSEQAMRIADITGAVDGLARQSKMLAINASIEAVHAGEAGQGFGVVAAEVAVMAEQSVRATHEVHKILEEIQGAAHKAVAVTEEGGAKMQEGARLANATGQVVRSLVETVRETASSSQNLTDAVTRQTNDMGQIGNALRELDSVSRDLEANARHVSEAVERMLSELDRQSQGMG